MSRRRNRRLWRVAGWLTLGVAGLMLAAVLAHIGVFLRLDQPAEAIAARWLQPPARMVTVQGLQVHLIDVGPRDDRQPIVLLPGTESGLWAFRPWVEALAEKRRVITLDLPGFGLSDNMPQDDYGSDTYARFVLALLDQLGVARCTLVGHDFGGEVAWQTAYLQPERVGKLLLIAARGYPSDPWKRSLDDKLLRFGPTAWLGRITRSPALVKRGVLDRVAQQGSVDRALIDRYVELPLRAGNRRAEMLRREQDRDGAQADRIKSLQMPTLILWGENDRQTPSQQAFWFERDIPGAKARLLPTLGHLLLEEDPNAVLDAARDFLLD